MRKSKGIGTQQLGVMDGVTTRENMLAMEASPATNKKRKFDSTEEFRCSRRRRETQEESSCNRSSDCNSASECSSNGFSELVNDSLIRSDADLENESSSSCFDCRRRREITPSSNLREEESDDLGSMARPNERSRDERISPSEEEIEEFFSTTEKEEQRRFTEKYNYDIVKDVPLEGRYEWVRLKP